MTDHANKVNSRRIVFRNLGIFFSAGLGTFILLFAPFYLLPLIPLVLGPFFISLSDLPKQTKFYLGVYPFVLFTASYFIFHHRDDTPRIIRFDQKAWHEIYFGISGEPKIERKDGFDLIDFRGRRFILTGREQGDIIPVSDSKYYFHGSKDSLPRRIYIYQGDNESTSESDIFLFYEIAPYYGEDLVIDDVSSELFFIGTYEDYECRLEKFPFDSFLITKNQVLKAYLDKKSK